MQLLWINVFLDLAAVIAITTGFPIDSLMKTPPYNIKDKILTDEMKFEIVYLATYQITILLTMLFCSSTFLGLPYNWNTPFWVTEDLIKTEVYQNSIVGDPTNKTVVFTMVAYCYVLM